MPTRSAAGSRPQTRSTRFSTRSSARWSSGDRVSVTGFGSFEKVDRPARYARNPQTGERVRVKKTSVPRFRAGQGFKDLVSGSKKLPRGGEVAVKKAPKGSLASGAPVTAKAAAKKATAKKATAAKKAAAKKTTAAAKKAAAKKTTAKKTTAKKAAAKKTHRQEGRRQEDAPAKKAAAKKAPAKTSHGTQDHRQAGRRRK